TLTVQVAARLDEHTLAVQLYHSPAIPPPPATLDPGRYLPVATYDRFCERVILRPALPLTRDLSPMRLWRDVTGQTDLAILTRAEGLSFLDRLDQAAMPPNGVRWSRGRWRVQEVQLTLVGHFLRADLCRIFGADFWHSLRTTNSGGRRVAIRQRKL